MHGTLDYLSELHYGFDADHFYLRVDPVPEALGPLRDFEFRVLIRAAAELRIAIRLEAWSLKDVVVERDDSPLPSGAVEVAFDRILEVSVAGESVPFTKPQIEVSVALWHGALPLDVLPVEGKLEIPLGEEGFAWAVPPLV